jgi:hypothetical protein
MLILFRLLAGKGLNQKFIIVSFLAIFNVIAVAYRKESEISIPGNEEHKKLALEI